jgi:hypothetical protein
MTFNIAFRKHPKTEFQRLAIRAAPHSWPFLVLLALLLIPLPVFPQVSLTGAIQFSTNSTGGASGGQDWNTLGGDAVYDLWLALNPDATSPVNGPSDAQAAIDISLEAGHGYKFYIFGQPGASTGFNGLNLFFEGNNSAPGISVFGATDSPSFLPDSSTTFTLQGTSVAGAGSVAYSSGGVTVVLVGYDWNSPATPPGDVCQSKEFSPGDGPDFYGSFTLRVFPAASLSLSPVSGSPGTKLTIAGTGFAPAETVDVFAGRIGGTPIAAPTADSTGSFTVTPLETQLPYGPANYFALGLTSGKLGAAAMSVTPGLLASPGTGEPGGTTEAYTLGFGSGEIVDVYWNSPRQLLGAVTSNAEGSGTLVITIPASAPLGINGLIGVGQTTKAIGLGAVRVN